MSEQLQLRRGTASQVQAFTGAAGEVVFDTTNNRIVANDGTTVGGSPAAKLSETITNTRTAVSDASYTVLATDRTVAYTALTAARVVALPASSAYPTGTRLLIVDETGNCGVTNTIAVNAAGTDTIDGAASVVVNQAFGFIGLDSSGAGHWTIIDQGFMPASLNLVAAAHVSAAGVLIGLRARRHAQQQASRSRGAQKDALHFRPYWKEKAATRRKDSREGWKSTT